MANGRMRWLRAGAAVLGVGLALLGLSGVAGADDPSFKITLPEGATPTAARPEGVATDGDDVYVGSVGSGAVFHFRKGERAAKVFLAPGGDGRTAVTGLKAEDGLLYVSGAGTGQMFVYDLSTKALVFKTASGVTPTFINDVDIDGDGAAYFTDSQSPYLYRVAKSDGVWAMERFITFTGTPFAYTTGFNANGIVIDDDDEAALIVQSNTGKLFRVDLRTKAVSQVDLGGASVAGGDGLLRRGQTLYVISGAAGITELRLRDHDSKARVVGVTTDPTFAGTTTAARQGGRLYVVNAQFSAGANPVVPFWVSNVKMP